MDDIYLTELDLELIGFDSVFDKQLCFHFHFLPPGIYAMPVAKSGRQLPNARTISSRLFADRPISSRVMSNLNMQWGQFVTHDIVFQVMEVTGMKTLDHGVWSTVTDYLVLKGCSIFSS